MQSTRHDPTLAALQAGAGLPRQHGDHVGSNLIGSVAVRGKRSVRTVVDKLPQPAGVAYKDGALYVVAIDKVTTAPNSEAASGRISCAAVA